MTDYTLQCQYNPPSSAIPDLCQSGFFFNEPEHLRQQNAGLFHLLTALNQHTGQAEARCAFFVRPSGAVSPGAAPFGSIEFKNTLPDLVLNEFLDALTEAARAAGASTLRLVNYPHCYAPEQAVRLMSKLPEHGFQLIETYQTSVLPITTASFENNIVPSERRRLRKCREAGFQAEHWVLPNVAEVVDFLEETRRQQGYQLTIRPEHLTDLLQKFPEQFLIFTVTDGSQLAAQTVAIRVREDILYNFMPASHPAYQRFSPMVMLTAGLFTYCQQQSIRLLDLGTSLDGNNQPKPSLMRFKQNLGAQESPKLVFERLL